MRGSTAFQRVVAALLCGIARNSKETASGKASLPYGTADTPSSGTAVRRYGSADRLYGTVDRLLWDGRLTQCDDRPALRDALVRHGALWDGIPTLWDGSTDAMGRQLASLFRTASEGLPSS